ncbi:MAG: enoyl-CoA hydratase/isomerase family protein [Armatimonadota bacterium]
MSEILVDRRGAVARVRLNRPERLNAIDVPAMRDALTGALDMLDADTTVHVVILTGAGDRAFSTGWDLSSLGDPAEDYDDATLMHILTENATALMRVWEIRQPIIAAINGYALGAGASLALLCDLAIAAETAQLGEPEIRHWALPPVLVMPYLAGSKAAHLHAYTGQAISAGEMLHLGLVNAVVPLGALEDAAWELGERIARVPPLSVQTAKRSLKQAYERMGFKEAQHHHRALDAALLRADVPEKRRLMEILKSQGLSEFLKARDR